jgi:hypothetical protein
MSITGMTMPVPLLDRWALPIDPILFVQKIWTFVNPKKSILQFSHFDLAARTEIQGGVTVGGYKTIDRKFLHINTINCHCYDLACNSLWVCLELLACGLFFHHFFTAAHEDGTPRTQQTSDTASLGVL